MLIEVRPTPTGRKVVAKQAGTFDEAARLRREAELLELARHPGVVEVLGVDGDPARPVLLTAHIQGPTLAAAGALAVEEAAGVLAALATTLADLHGLGVVHGSVGGDHVVLDGDGAPVLCGFGHGGRVGEHQADGAVLDGPVDVFDLGMLARSLCPPRSPEARALRRVVETAVATEPDDRPTARALADSISTTVPGARLPRPKESGGHDRVPPLPVTPPAVAVDPLDAWRRLQSPSRSSDRSPGRVVAAAGVTAVLVAALVWATTLRGTPSVAPSAPDQPVALDADPTTTAATEPEPPGPATSTSAAAPAARAPTPAQCPAVAAGLSADVDGDACADSLRYADGVLVAGDARWSVGRSGDQAVTGDWSCTGLRTLALLRPSTGELFRFDRWPAAGADAEVTAFARVDGGTALRAADLDQDGCHEMVVERDGGPPEVVVPARGTP